ncbi:MAG: helix-turn-helix domain-containing protein [Solirubrobacteraceae bacterium]
MPRPLGDPPLRAHKRATDGEFGRENPRSLAIWEMAPPRASEQPASEHDRAESLLTAREVASALGVSCETVLRWTRAGKLPGFRMPGGALRYQPNVLRAWLAERATDHVNETRAADAVAGRKLTGTGKRRRGGGKADAADTTRTGVQAQLW